VARGLRHRVIYQAISKGISLFGVLEAPYLLLSGDLFIGRISTRYHVVLGVFGRRGYIEVTPLLFICGILIEGRDVTNWYPISDESVP